MAQKLTQEQRKKFAEDFLELDTDGNGVLSREEVAVWLKDKGYNLSDQETEKVFRWMDANADGKITLDEFLAAMVVLESDRSTTSEDSGAGSSASSRTSERQSQRSQAGRPAEDDLADIFNSMDLNGDGQLSEDEMLRGLLAAGYDVNRRQVRKLIASLDTDGDGQICYSEFIAAYRG